MQQWFLSLRGPDEEQAFGSLFDIWIAPPNFGRRDMETKMNITSDSRTGFLVDLGPDGLGFVIPSDDPTRKLAFTSKRTHLSDLEWGQLEEGATVRYGMDRQGKIEVIELVASRH